jgi:AAA15 family ATPase/GTPase
MISYFSVVNFRSIKNRVEFDLTKTALKGNEGNATNEEYHKKRVLKSAMIYGANASGKTNFIEAFKALQYMVLASSKLQLDEDIPPYEPHKLDINFRDAPVEFELHFLLKGIKHEFYLAYGSKKIIEESIHYYPNGVKSLLYKRDSSKILKFGDTYKGAKTTISKLLLDNQLFISKAVDNNVQSLLDIYRFIAFEVFLYSFSSSADEDRFRNLYLQRLVDNKDSKFSQSFQKLIAALDTGIDHMKIAENDFEKLNLPTHLDEKVIKKIQEANRYDVMTAHKVFNGDQQINETNFKIYEESTGTQKLIAISGHIIEALLEGEILIVDELEQSLHPNILQYLINLFHNPLVNKYNAQLIFSTHDITQLSNDSIRRDQVWFAEKDQYGATGLYRCSDIKGIRADYPLDKWYQTNRLGGTPIIEDYDFITLMQQSDEENTTI